MLPASPGTPRYHQEVISSRGRALAARLFSPVARGLLRLRVGPDLVTVLGAVAVVAAALWFLPRGQFVVGPLVVAACALFDSVDGLMARELERRGVARSQDFGAFLDSTLDRVADAAIFSGLILYFLGAGDRAGVVLALACLVFGSVVPYARARAEGLGMTASVGIAERADRIVLVLLGTFAVGLGAPGWVLLAVLAVLALASAVTVVQRIATVRQQSTARMSAAGAAPEPAPAGTARPVPAPHPFPDRPLPWYRSRRDLHGPEVRGSEPVLRRRFRVLAPRAGSSARRPR